MRRVRTTTATALVIAAGLLAGCGEAPIGSETNLAKDLPPPPPQLAHAKVKAGKVYNKNSSPDSPRKPGT